MKKIISFLLLLLLGFTLISCGDNNDPGNDPEKIVEKDFMDYKGTIYNTNNFTSVDEINLVGNYKLAKNVQDGVILHAWNWSYNTIKDNLQSIASAGFSTIQTSPVQQPKEYSKAITGIAKSWWKLYQPLSFSVAEESWLGTKDELISLCTEAKQYGIKIIVDIVANHLAGGTATSLNENVRKYEEEIYDNNLIHNDFDMKDFNNLNPIRRQVAAPLDATSDYPDLKTESPIVQERVISLLKECIDCGVSGFRFDAAKHIATETDGDYASDFWVNVLETTTAYGQTKGVDVYYYGEILDGLEIGRRMDTYLSKMSVTDNGASSSIMQAYGANLENFEEDWGDNFSLYLHYAKTNDPKKIVLWLESHDTFTAGKGGKPEYYIKNAWPLVAARYGSTALYFARPNTSGSADTFTYLSEMGEVGTTTYLNPIVAQTNKFRNAFIGATEEITYQGNFLVLERKRQADNKVGVILMNIEGSEKEYAYKIRTNLADGLYIDQISGNRFLVENGLLEGKLSGRTAILYQTEKQEVITKPIITSTLSTTKFYQGQEPKITITLSINDSTKNEYKIDDGNYQTLTSNKIEVNKECVVSVKATNGNAVTVKEINVSDIEYIEKKAGYIAVAGTSQEYIDNYNIYAWVWQGNKSSQYKEVLIEGTVIYIPYTNGDTGCLLAAFDKDKTFDKINPKTVWTSCLYQTEDYAVDPNICYSSTLK